MPRDGGGVGLGLAGRIRKLMRAEGRGFGWHSGLLSETQQ